MPLHLFLQSSMKPSFLRILGLAIFLSIGALSNRATWEFSLARHKLSTLLPFANLGDFPPSLLAQRWVLSAEGGQSYVFFSQDGSYVLKFFKDQPRPWLRWPAYQAQKNKKLIRTLTGYSLFMERCHSISGLQFLHVQAKNKPLPAILIDRLGIAHSVDLQSYLFVLQRRAKPLIPPASSEEKEQLLAETSLLLKTLAKSHLKDHDPRFHLNLGHLDGKLIVMDPGRIAHSTDTSQALPDKFYEFLR